MLTVAVGLAHWQAPFTFREGCIRRSPTSTRHPLFAVLRRLVLFADDRRILVLGLFEQIDEPAQVDRRQGALYLLAPRCFLRRQDTAMDALRANDANGNLTEEAVEP
jgi:hypothetical protein